MAAIQVLPKHVAELIAAGEVVERPASVAKELLENAIDAGATAVTLEIKNGGITYIRITDNGCGIERDDVPTAFISHATSKLHSAQDLHSIATLGFRGEALPSIAAVSRVEVLTRAQGEQIGTRYCIEGGEQTLLDDAGCPRGTTLIVRDLFYNTPARIKFLKKDVTEANAVAGVADHLALSHPEVSIRFIRDGREKLLTPGDSKLHSAIYAVCGRDFAEKLLSVSYELGGIKITGFTAHPTAARPNRSMQLFFLNGRLVRTGTGMSALEQAYKNSIQIGKFPACVLHIEAPLETVDVNVHPAKTEVRFANEKRIFEAIYYAVKNTLEADTSRPAVDFDRLNKPQPRQAAQPAAEQIQMPQKRADFWQTDSACAQRPPQHRPPAIQTQVRMQDSTVYQSKQEEQPDSLAEFFEKRSSSAEAAEDIAPLPASEPVREEEKDDTQRHNTDGQSDAPEQEAAQDDVIVQPPAFRVIGEVFATYILVESENRFLLIDKHAAHERMLFEELKAQRQDASAQLLLSPVTVTLPKEEYDAVLNNLELLAQSGFEAEDFGPGTVLVRACPLSLTQEDAASLMMELAGYLLTNRQELLPEKLDWMYHNVACRAAIKAGHSTKAYEMEKLVARLLADDSIRYCPHGRPVLIEMTRHELEKQFGRIQ